MRAEFPVWFLCFPAMLGLAFGSFLNVCIVRLPQGQSVVRPRSRCPACKAPIAAWQNIPMLSWLILRGRCKACGKRIAIFYPLVELAVALWFVSCFIQFENGLVGDAVASGIHAVSAAVLGWLLLGLMVMDARDGLLPNSFTLGGGLAGILLLAASTVTLPADPGTVMFTTPEKIVFGRVAAVLMVSLGLLVVRWVYKKLRGQDGMGLGDVKMTAMLAAFLGLHLTMMAFLVACIAGSLFAVVLMMRPRDKKTAVSVPFGSFLAIGGMYALLLGQATLHWYLGFF